MEKIYTDEDVGKFYIEEYFLKTDTQKLCINATVKVCYKITSWVGDHLGLIEDDEPDSTEVKINWVDLARVEIYDEEGNEINYKFTENEYSKFLSYCHDIAEEKVSKGDLYTC